MTLEKCWPELGWFAMIRRAITKIVRRIREVTSLGPGGLETGECNLFWLEDYCGLPLHVAGMIPMLDPETSGWEP